MKVSEITIKDVAEYLRLEEDDYSAVQMTAMLDAAKEFVSDYTGIPQHENVTDSVTKTLDDYEKFPIAVFALCQDMYDNRALYVEKSNVNKVVDSILNMHRTNFV